MFCTQQALSPQRILSMKTTLSNLRWMAHFLFYEYMFVFAYYCLWNIIRPAHGIVTKTVGWRGGGYKGWWESKVCGGGGGPEGGGGCRGVWCRGWGLRGGRVGVYCNSRSHWIPTHSSSTGTISKKVQNAIIGATGLWSLNRIPAGG